MQKSFWHLVVSVVGAVVLGTGLVSAATTISTDIQTDGLLSVTGTTTLTGKVGVGNSSPRTTLEVTGDLIVASSTNLNIRNPEFGWGVNNITAFGGGFHTVLNGRINGTNGGTAHVVIGGSVTADSSGSAFDTVVGTGASVTNSANASAFGRNASVSASDNSTAIGFGAVVSTLPADIIALGDASARVWVAGKLGIATTSPAANFQVANGSNATTTAEFGSSGQNKGSCLKLYRTDGSAIYAYIAAGATTFTLTTTACASVADF